VIVVDTQDQIRARNRFLLVENPDKKTAAVYAALVPGRSKWVSVPPTQTSILQPQALLNQLQVETQQQDRHNMDQTFLGNRKTKPSPVLARPQNSPVMYNFKYSIKRVTKGPNLKGFFSHNPQTRIKLKNMTEKITGIIRKPIKQIKPW
jgi:hypothetical protein